MGVAIYISPLLFQLEFPAEKFPPTPKFPRLFRFPGIPEGQGFVPR